MILDLSIGSSLVVQGTFLRDSLILRLDHASRIDEPVKRIHLPITAMIFQHLVAAEGIAMNAPDASAWETFLRTLSELLQDAGAVIPTVIDGDCYFHEPDASAF